MPISDNIINEIKKLDADKSFKNLMTTILKQEDAGLSQKAYKAEYKSIVDAFIKKKEAKHGSGSD